MVFKDITNDTNNLYRLKKDEKIVFFMLNREGNIAFEMVDRGAEAHVFAFHVGKGNVAKQLHITQRHVGSETTSSVLVKSALFDSAELSYEGLIHITRSGNKARASQESRSLLLSEDAKVFTKPALEILANDVVCRHAATVSPLNMEALFFARTRGLSEERSRALLLKGFFHEAFEKIEAFGIETQNLQEKLSLP